MDNGPNTIDPKTGRPYVSSDELYRLFATPGQPTPMDDDIERLLMERFEAAPNTACESNLTEGKA